MAAEQFLARWSRRKAESTTTESPAENAAVLTDQAVKADPESGVTSPVINKAPEQFTIEDVQKITPDSDFSPFMARGVDEDVKRSALKKLFTDPHYNVMDGLDIYIDDYNKFEPLPAAMLAMLNHAKMLLNPLDHLKLPPSTLISEEELKVDPAGETSLQEHASSDPAAANHEEKELQVDEEDVPPENEAKLHEQVEDEQTDNIASEPAINPTHSL